MTRLLLAGALALTAAGLVPASSQAQDPVQRPGVLARTPSYSSLMSALNASATAADRIKSRQVAAEDIRIIDASTVIGTENEKAITDAMTTHKDHLDAIRTALGANPSFTAALQAHQAKPEAKDVIAVDIQDEGEVLVYFRKP